MLMEMVKGRKADEIAALPKEELLEEIGIPLTPIRLKCALLGLGVLKVALHRAKGTPLPDEWAGLDELELSLRAESPAAISCARPAIGLRSTEWPRSRDLMPRSTWPPAR